MKRPDMTDATGRIPYRFPRLLRCLLLILVCSPVVVQAQSPDSGTPFPGTVDSFHGFDRHTFQFDGARCFVVRPERAAEGTPWIWRARFFGHEPQVDVALLKRGFHVAYIDVGGLFGAPVAVKRWNRFYEHLTNQYGFAEQPVLEGMSRGGLIVLNWAAANPERVAAIYIDAPVCDIRSWPGGKGDGKGSPRDWQACLKVYGLTEAESESAAVSPIDRLEPLAKAKVPILSVCGHADVVVPMAENTDVVRRRYEQLGGPIRVIAKPGVGHHPHSLKAPEPIVEFLLEAMRSEP